MSVTELNRHLQTLLPGVRLEPQSLRQCPEIALYLINPDYPQHTLAPQTVAQLMDEPPYWAFCWASGQVLARYLLDNPAVVAGRHVVDFGAGSGVVGIAAALAGASRVSCCDSDPLARLAIAANAELNRVELQSCGDIRDLRPDVIALADVLYDHDNLPLLQQLLPRAPLMLLADSRVRNLALEPLRLLGQYTSSTWPDLDESAEFNEVRLYGTASA